MWTMPFGLPVDARGVEDEERMLAVERLRRAVGATRSCISSCHQMVAARLHVRSCRVAERADDDARARPSGDLRQRLVDVFLERDDLAAAIAAVGGDEHLGLASLMRSATAPRREKPPKTTVCVAPMRAQASIAIDRLGDHRHVDRDEVALGDAQPLQDVGELRRPRVELLIGERRGVAGLALPDDGGLVPPRAGAVAVDAVVRRR